MRPWIIGALRTRKLLEAADSLAILDRYSLKVINETEVKNFNFVSQNLNG